MWGVVLLKNCTANYIEKVLLKQIFENLGVMIAYLDMNFNFLSVNFAYAKGAGFKPDEFVGKNYFELFPNEETKKIFETAKMTGQEIEFFDKPFEHAGHFEHVTYWNWTFYPVKDQKGRIHGFFCFSMKLLTVNKWKKNYGNLKNSTELCLSRLLMECCFLIWME